MSSLQDLVDDLMLKREEYLYQEQIEDNDENIDIAFLALEAAQNELDNFINNSSILKNIVLLHKIGYFRFL